MFPKFIFKDNRNRYVQVTKVNQPKVSKCGRAKNYTVQYAKLKR